MNLLQTSAGCMSQYHAAWESLTFDEEVLQAIKGFKLELDEIPEIHESSGFNYEIPTAVLEPLHK